MKNSQIIICFCLCFITQFFVGQKTEAVIYKRTKTDTLKLDIFYPSKIDTTTTQYPALLFFHGGGWQVDIPRQFEPHSQYFAKKGLICFSVEYRIESIHGTTPFEALKDAKSAMRFIRKNADRFYIDPDKIIVVGASAGGHLAASLALIPGFNDESDDLEISTMPNATVLFNPVIDNGPAGYGYERLGVSYKDFSPLHNVKEGVPPTLILTGTNDHLIPVETIQYFKKAIEKTGGRCDLELYEGAWHGFFNYEHTNYYNVTVYRMEEFLMSLGYIN